MKCEATSVNCDLSQMGFPHINIESIAIDALYGECSYRFVTSSSASCPRPRPPQHWGLSTSFHVIDDQQKSWREMFLKMEEALKLSWMLLAAWKVWPGWDLLEEQLSLDIPLMPVQPHSFPCLSPDPCEPGPADPEVAVIALRYSG